MGVKKSPDTNEELDVEYYLLPSGEAFSDPYVKAIWDAAVAELQSAEVAKGETLLDVAPKYALGEGNG